MDITQLMNVRHAEPAQLRKLIDQALKEGKSSYRIAAKDRSCSRCENLILKGAWYLLWTPRSQSAGLNTRLCRDCNRAGLCAVGRTYRGMADIGSDLSCNHKATGTTSAGTPCCGHHSDAAVERARNMSKGRK